jgi:hypothetical protein
VSARAAAVLGFGLGAAIFASPLFPIGCTLLADVITDAYYKRVGLFEWSRRNRPVRGLWLERD